MDTGGDRFARPLRGGDCGRDTGATPPAWFGYRRFLASSFGSLSAFAWRFATNMPLVLSANLPKSPNAYRSLIAALCWLLCLPVRLLVGMAWLVVFIFFHSRASSACPLAQVSVAESSEQQPHEPLRDGPASHQHEPQHGGICKGEYKMYVIPGIYKRKTSIQRNLGSKPCKKQKGIKRALQCQKSARQDKRSSQES